MDTLFFCSDRFQFLGFCKVLCNSLFFFCKKNSFNSRSHRALWNNSSHHVARSTIKSYVKPWHELPGRMLTVVGGLGPPSSIARRPLDRSVDRAIPRAPPSLYLLSYTGVGGLAVLGLSSCYYNNNLIRMNKTWYPTRYILYAPYARPKFPQIIVLKQHRTPRRSCW